MAPVLALPRPDAPRVLGARCSPLTGAPWAWGFAQPKAPGKAGACDRAYASRGYHNRQRGFSNCKGEWEAAMEVLQHFQAYMQDRRFTLVIDHQPLKWLMRCRDLRGT